MDDLNYIAKVYSSKERLVEESEVKEEIPRITI